MPDYLTNTEAATLLRVAPETLRYWRHVDKGPISFKLEGRVLYAREDVEAYIAQAREAAGSVRG